MLDQRPTSWLAVALTLALAGCRAPTVEPPRARPRTRSVEIPHDPIAAPSWERAANVRLWTVALAPAQIEALRPQPGLPTFVRMSPGGLELVACADAPSVEWTFEPELPVAQRFVWSDEELAANVRVGAGPSSRDPFELGLVPIGTYWLDPGRRATLRRQVCEDATHVVVGVRVGQWPAEGSRCTLRPAVDGRAARAILWPGPRPCVRTRPPGPVSTARAPRRRPRRIRRFVTRAPTTSPTSPRACAPAAFHWPPLG